MYTFDGKILYLYIKYNLKPQNYGEFRLQRLFYIN